MQNRKRLDIARILFGLLTAAAIITQLIDGVAAGRSTANFLSFFTIQSNILAAVILLTIGIYRLKGGESRQIAFVRGAMTLYMTMTGIIYVLLLSGNEVSLQTTIPWVNAVLHYVVPLVVIADWLILRPKIHTPFKKALLWLLFPLVYLIYSLIRGAFTGWYPYPFLNPVTTGWPSVVAMSIIITAGTVLLIWLITLRTQWPKLKRSM